MINFFKSSGELCQAWYTFFLSHTPCIVFSVTLFVSFWYLKHHLKYQHCLLRGGTTVKLLLSWIYTDIHAGPRIRRKKTGKNNFFFSLRVTQLCVTLLNTYNCFWFIELPGNYIMCLFMHNSLTEWTVSRAREIHNEDTQTSLLSAYDDPEEMKKIKW